MQSWHRFSQIFVRSISTASKSTASQAQRIAAYNIRGRSLSLKSNSTTVRMGKWESEKAKYLNMSIEEKRKFYKRLYDTLDGIPTWKEYATQQTLGEAIPLLPSHKIDAKKNEQIAQKVSLFIGDITTLEVRQLITYYTVINTLFM